MKTLLGTLAALWIVCLIVAFMPPPAKADVAIDEFGCEINLHHDNATSVTVFGPDTEEMYDVYIIENGTGTVALLEEYGIVYAAGDYIAEWDDGERENFTLTCPDDYEPYREDANYGEPELAPDEVLMPDDWIDPYTDENPYIDPLDPVDPNGPIRI